MIERDVNKQNETMKAAISGALQALFDMQDVYRFRTNDPFIEGRAQGWEKGVLDAQEQVVKAFRAAGIPIIKRGKSKAARRRRASIGRAR